MRGKILLAVGFVMAALIINLGPKLPGMLGGNQSGLSVWGANNYGQAGNGSAEYKVIKPFDTELDMPPVRQVALGLNHSIALTEDGKVYGWGSNLYGQIAQNPALKQKTVPMRINGLPEITQIAANQDHSVALDADGNVWTWGLNMSGQLGNGTNENSFKPLRVKGMKDVSRVAAGYRTTLAIRQDGSLWGWGGDCRLAEQDASLRDTVALLAVDGLYSTPMTSSAKTGTYTTLSPEEDCINEAVVGIQSLVPKRIEGLPELNEISAGFGHMIAIDKSGDVWTWGCNTYGQVGNGTVGRGEGANLKPAKVSGMSNVRAVSAGFRHSMVLKEDGSLWAWGHNFTGALGTGKVEDQKPHPTLVTNLPPLQSIAAGHDFSMALDRNGAVWGWGSGRGWQFSPDTKQRTVPEKAWSLTDVDAIVTGGGHVAAWQTKNSQDAGSRL